MYHNNYIPIENSAQRRLIFRIQCIDMEQKSTTDSFLPQCLPELQDRAMVTDTVQTAEVAAGQSEREGQQAQ